MTTIDWKGIIDFETLGIAELDLDAVFQRARDGAPRPEEAHLATLAMLMRFVERTEAQEPVEPFIQQAIANAITHVLAGGAWEDELPLPWIPISRQRSDAEQRSLDIYVYVATALRERRGAKVTHLFVEAGEEFACSMETARAHYYYWRKQLPSQSDPPLSE